MLTNCWAWVLLINTSSLKSVFVHKNLFNEHRVNIEFSAAPASATTKFDTTRDIGRFWSSSPFEMIWTVLARSTIDCMRGVMILASLLDAAELQRAYTIANPALSAKDRCQNVSGCGGSTDSKIAGYTDTSREGVFCSFPRFTCLPIILDTLQGRIYSAISWSIQQIMCSAQRVFVVFNAKNDCPQNRVLETTQDTSAIVAVKKWIASWARHKWNPTSADFACHITHTPKLWVIKHFLCSGTHLPRNFLLGCEQLVNWTICAGWWMNPLLGCADQGHVKWTKHGYIVMIIPICISSVVPELRWAEEISEEQFLGSRWCVHVLTVHVDAYCTSHA